jgi:putative FmdB family regulatory protein
VLCYIAHLSVNGGKESTMPIYEYQCERCHKKFEKLQSIHESPVKKCIYCQGQVRKLISPAAITFKGSGWYITDYKKRKKTPKKETVKTDSSKK